MVGNARAALTGPLVRIVTGTVVSAQSMVSRAFLRDSFLGMVVEAADGTLWLAATGDALAPDPEGLIIRGADNGGPPVEYGSARLATIWLSWGSVAGSTIPAGEVEVANPVVVEHPGGISAAVVRLAKARPLLEAIDAGTGPAPIRLVDGVGEVDATRTVDVLSLVQDGAQLNWPVSRTAGVVSDGGFFGIPGAVALDLEVEGTEAGAPVFVGPEHRLGGMVRPLTRGLSCVVPASAIVETIVHAQS